ncbi:MAG TPA: PBP1A family penicillin-binding protein [Acidimicrobiales bacterium]|nr:PBP1A family penicillin-binding protein [Acidimicrobiales bacterium]
MRRWLAAAALVAVAAAGCAYNPPDAALAPPPLAESTRLFDAHGRLITQLEAEENRENVSLSELPQHLLDAVVAIEDSRFWEHKGVDVKAILRAAVTNVGEGEVAEGGSTITQQYVKNALIGDDQTVNRKVKEAITAVQLERSSTKERILELYLNTIYFGNGAYGVQAASQEYFGKQASDITLAESALLAGLIRLPSETDPYDTPEIALERRNVVLDRMAELGLATDAAVGLAREEPLLVRVRPEEERYLAPHFVEQVKAFILEDERFGETFAERRRLLFGGGLRIQTTVDLDKQLLAETAVAGVRPEAPGPDAALVSMVPRTGFVESLVGGRDFFSGGERAKLDLATGGPGRPAGSSFKPLVLAAALEQGITLDRVYPAPSRLTIPLESGDWEVENYEGSGGGRATLFDATVRSYNTVYAQLIMDVGPEEAMDTARRMGVAAPLQPYPSAVLGTNDVHPLDMATAYATLANRGMRVDPVFVTRVTDAKGKVLYEHQHRQERAISEQTADEVTSVLQQAVERGTGTRARLDDRAVAGKTGTGQEWRDAWFVGFTPDVVTAVWMGFAEEGRRSMMPPATPIRVSGGTWPASIWHAYSEPALANTPVSDFAEVEPREDEDLPVDPEDLLLPIVPDVVGLPLAAAEAVLAEHGYEVRARDVAEPGRIPGTIARTRPRAGNRLAVGAVVEIDVAQGAVLVTVPDLLGMLEGDALASSFPVEVVLEPGGAPGVIWRQSPGGGESVIEGTTIRIWISPTEVLDEVVDVVEDVVDELVTTTTLTVP